jgi:hypothetical protein
MMMALHRASREDETLPTASFAPELPSAETRVESAIGEALLAISDVSLQAQQEYSNDGRVAPVTKAKGGALLAALYKLQRAIGEPDFAAIMRRQGRIQLRDGAGLSEAVADDVTDMIIRLVSQVATTIDEAGEL